MELTIEEAFAKRRFREIGKVIEDEIAHGGDPYLMIKRCQDAMEEIGKKYETGEYFLAELMLAARMFETAASILSPLLSSRGGSQVIGKIVLGTPRGDVHDLGKNIFRVMAQAGGFEVIDLGIDVPASKFLEAVQKEDPDIVGMSALVTTTYPSMQEVIKTLEREGIRKKVKIVIGGGATGEEARLFVGADAQTLDAAEGVRICAGFMRASS